MPVHPSAVVPVTVYVDVYDGHKVTVEKEQSEVGQINVVTVISELVFIDFESTFIIS